MTLTCKTDLKVRLKFCIIVTHVNSFTEQQLRNKLHLRPKIDPDVFISVIELSRVKKKREDSADELSTDNALCPCTKVSSASEQKYHQQKYLHALGRSKE